MKTVRITNAEDRKCIKGNWLKSYRETPFIQHETRSGILWGSIQQRCNIESKKGKSVTYSGCENKFNNFNEFTEWCHSQTGYLNKDLNGRYWAIDKDLVVPFSKSYSPETCIFVPQKVNSLMTLRSNHKGGTPTGVTWHNRDNIFESKCHNGEGKQIYLGRYNDALEAHFVWARYKLGVITRLLEEKEIANHFLLIDSLNRWVEHFKYCIERKIEITY